jgi:hypothetical protein
MMGKSPNAAGAWMRWSCLRFIDGGVNCLSANWIAPGVHGSLRGLEFP